MNRNVDEVTAPLPELNPMNWPRRFATRTTQMKRSTIRELLKLTAQPDMISFAGGLPAPELFPIAQVQAATNTILNRHGAQALQYGETEGLAELRDWIARQSSRPGLPLTRSNVGIVSGAQQALDLIGRVLLNEGDKVIVENPTYIALLSAWRPLGIEFLPAPCDARGICVEDLEPLLRQRPKLLYTVPNFQNPQGTTLSAERRARLVEMLRQHDVGLVEDDPYHELRYQGDSLPSLLELDARLASPGGPENNVIYVGTFSKVLAPGLRVGWVVAPEEVVDKLVQAKQASDLHTSTLSQHIIYELVRNHLLEEQIPLLRHAYRERRDAMLSALEKHFPRGTTWTKPDGGMFLMVTLPTEINATDLLQRALQQKVAFVPGEAFHLHGQGQNTLRLNFSNAAPDKIEAGIRRLGSLLDKPV
ncbi:MAG: PLP-dependent aminotransferase family protein [Pedosphaera sp.]|nr:PLP-dependent aminotransferase family protein [Pedosphaera sp.]